MFVLQQFSRFRHVIGETELPTQPTLLFFILLLAAGCWYFTVPKGMAAEPNAEMKVYFVSSCL
jgi:hypothetical protein